MTHHSREDALNEQEFRHLFETAKKLDEPYATETRFIVIAGGRLGMRAGEIAHFHRDWINWDRQMISIPQHRPCTKGRNGGICGYCRKRARERIVSNNVTIEEAMVEVREDLDSEKIDESALRELALKHRREVNITYEEAVAERWEPKTSNSARTIYFGFSDIVAGEIERFVWHYDEYPRSRVSVNRRVARAAKASDLSNDDTYPHCLRASAAMNMAYRGLDVFPLMAFMGWGKVDVARSYIKADGGATANAVDDVYTD